jgi:phosphatidate cytidylyltransferase
MFKQRIITAACLIPFVLAGIYYASWQVFAFILGAIVLFSSWEWTQFIPLSNRGLRLVYVAFQLICLILGFYTLSPMIMALCLFIWFYLLICIVFFPNSEKLWAYPPIVFILGLLLLTLFYVSLIYLLQLDQGKAYFFMLLFIVWAADSGAYCTGKLLGKHKLLPKVSPGKTLEGVAGGICASLLVMLLGYWYFNPPVKTVWFVGGILIVLISIAGDLLISMFKRHVKIKDSGHVLPGHGGILDRLDSLIAVSPFYYLGLYYFIQGNG